MRTTIRLDDQLVAEAKQLAARTGRTLGQVVEDAVRQALARSERSAHGRRPPRRLPTAGGEGVLPGVDLDDSAGLLELMERHDPG